MEGSLLWRPPWSRTSIWDPSAGLSPAAPLAGSRVRQPLIEAVEKVDHVALLGDSIELRDGPPREALEVAAPFLQQLGGGHGGCRVTVAAGNHDYELASVARATPSAERRSARTG